MNPLAWVVTAFKTWPEPVSLPESLEGADALTLAEARSRLAQISQVATELRRQVDDRLAGALQGSSLRYGESIIRANNGKGAVKVTSPSRWWQMVAEGIARCPQPAELLDALYPAESVRLTALPKLAAALQVDAGILRETMFHNDPPTQPLTVMPLSKAPKWLQSLEEGQLSTPPIGSS